VTEPGIPAVDHPALAVFAPPKLAALRERLGIGPDAAITADFTGWCKLVLLTEDLAICVPRDHTLVEPMRREIAALELVGDLRIPSVPVIREVVEDTSLSVYPILVCERMPGIGLDRLVESMASEDLGRLFEDLGRRTARWHEIPVADAAVLGHRDGLAPVVAYAASLHLAADERRWTDRAVEIADALPRVVVHGDIHEGQLLVDPDPPHELTGILDWQTARVDHPFVDFDLGEWGTAMWRGHRVGFVELRRRAFAAYAAERGLSPAVGAAFEWFHACSHARRLSGDGNFPVVHPPGITGTPAEARAAITTALRTLADLGS
jgi:aminoglycoside phosphotransferase (APT) family kinase protein